MALLVTSAAEAETAGDKGDVAEAVVAMAWAMVATTEMAMVAVTDLVTRPLEVSLKQTSRSTLRVWG